eukprot:SAG22_NODE_9324_length_596_cov_0.929577_1_plen_61_part_00
MREIHLIYSCTVQCTAVVARSCRGEKMAGDEAAARAAFVALDPDEMGWLAEADLPRGLER